MQTECSLDNIAHSTASNKKAIAQAKNKLSSKETSMSFLDSKLFAACKWRGDYSFR